MVSYRPHIDGLRAIAVLSVIVFHLNKEWLPGGFVGVDIFFVISGFLISKIILKELEQTSNFSYKNFYIRRFRRLFPAMVATFIFSIAAAYFLLSPQYLADFSKSTIAAVFSVSNFYFWANTNYFDTSAYFKPLLHTWSLAIEEQFYMFWPLTMVLLYRRWSQSGLLKAIVIIGILSLMLNLVLFGFRSDISSWFSINYLSVSFDVDATAFYWLPFRVFEFAIGAALIFIDWDKCTRFTRMTCFIVGFGLLVYSLIFLHEGLDFPSYYALIPCVATALIIVSGSDHIFAKMLSNRLLISIGLISYSLYLVHWPVIVFYELSLLREASITDYMIMVAITFVSALLLYKFVEQPFRKPRQSANSAVLGNRTFLVTCFGSMLVVVGVSAHAYIKDGWASRYPVEVMSQITRDPQEYVRLFADSEPYYSGPFENNGKPKVLLIGDSMSADLINAMVEGGSIDKLDVTSLRVWHQCYNIFPLDDATYREIYGSKHAVCRAQHESVMREKTLIQQADTVILAAYWFNDKVQSHIGKTVAYIKDLGVSNVMVLGQKQQAFDGTHLLGSYPLALLKKLRLQPNPKTTQLNKLLKSNAKNFFYFDLLDEFCNDDGCRQSNDDGYVIVFDRIHLTPEGAAYVGRNFEKREWFKRIMKE